MTCNKFGTNGEMDSRPAAAPIARRLDVRDMPIERNVEPMHASKVGGPISEFTVTRSKEPLGELTDCVNSMIGGFVKTDQISYIWV